MKNRFICFLLALILVLCGCGGKKVKTVDSLKLADGCYLVETVLEGGTGRATVSSPARLDIEDGNAFLTLEWSSPFYDYMKVDGVRYDFLSNDSGSVFRFPVSLLDEPFSVTADTVAMSTPHEIDYRLTLKADSIVKQ